MDTLLQTLLLLQLAGNPQPQEVAAKIILPARSQKAPQRKSPYIPKNTRAPRKFSR